MNKRNKVLLSGMVLDNPKFSHQRKNGGRYYLVMLASRRKSGVFDVIRCVIPERMVTEFSAGKYIGVHGEIRKHSSEEQMQKLGKRNITYVLVSDTYEWKGEDDNFVILTGKVHGISQRSTPLGVNIADLLLEYDSNIPGRSSYVACIIWHENALRTVDTEIGDEIVIYGRLQSRDYQKTVETGEVKNITTYEISVGRFHYF